MSKILDNIEPEDVQTYFQRFSEDLEFQENVDTKVQNIMDFLEWAYERDYIGFFKYQQIKDQLANKSLLRLSEQAKENSLPEATLTSRVVDQQKQAPFYIAHAYLLLPLITGVIVIIVYLFLGYNAQTISPVKIDAPVSTRTSQGNNSSYVVSFQDELVDEFGIPLNTSTPVRFRLYSSPEGGEALYDGRNVSG